MSFEQLTLFVELKSVELESSFEEILGSRQSEMSEAIRRYRWARWLKLARREDKGRVKCWMEPEGCKDCINHRGKAWCSEFALPCTVNPIVTFREGVLGIACMGFGYQRASVVKQ